MTQDTFDLGPGFESRDPAVIALAAIRSVAHIGTTFTARDVRECIERGGESPPRLGPYFRMAQAAGICIPTGDAIMVRVGGRNIPMQVWRPAVAEEGQ